MSQNIAAIYDKSDVPRGLNMHFQSGAQKSMTPYRSVGRVNTLLKGSGFTSSYG
jgi:hypothetical protein